MFSTEDIELIRSKKIKPEEVIKQIDSFKRGFLPAQLVAPATVGNGLNRFEDTVIDDRVSRYDELVSGREIVKFVPASGAASRMFKPLLSFYKQLEEGRNPEELILKDDSFNSPQAFFNRIKDFAFYETLNTVLNEHEFKLGKLLQDKNYQTLLKYFLSAEGMDYASLPKALLHFHKYGKQARTSIEEHLSEAAKYARNSGNKAKVHFTFSPEHIGKIQELLARVLPGYEEMLSVKFEIEHSIQDPATDTIAVNPDNTPFRETGGSLLFRPGGHGALIKNLNEIKADIIFIKNIDNVVPDILKEPTLKYKKLIGSYLILLQEKIFNYLERLDKEVTNLNLLNEIKNFYTQELMIRFPDDFEKKTLDEKRDYLYKKLNRPTRVCGMVKNEGEPGGGPFLVRDADGGVSLQIVEGSQVNRSDPGQAGILKLATYFNPVDLVVATRDYKGKYFNLNCFVDPETAFVSEKTKDGKRLKALELPGLWNGAMADWNTAFVEVPISTFNPVKYINDLLREQHQA